MKWLSQPAFRPGASQGCCDRRTLGTSLHGVGVTYANQRRQAPKAARPSYGLKPTGRMPPFECRIKLFPDLYF